MIAHIDFYVAQFATIAFVTCLDYYIDIGLLSNDEGDFNYANYLLTWKSAVFTIFKSHANAIFRMLADERDLPTYTHRRTNRIF